jgi:hypothetical protein
VEADREAYEEFWRSRAADYGLDGVAVPDAEPAER